MSDGEKEDQGPRSAWALPENDPSAAGVVGWEGMGARERLTACLSAVLIRWPLDPATFRYDARKDLVYVLRENPDDPKRSAVATRAPLEASVALDHLRGALGDRALDVHRACACRAERAAKILGAIR